MFKVNNKNSGMTHKLTIKTAGWRTWRRSGVFIDNFEQIW